MFERYTKKIVDILEASDLEKVTARQIRKQVQKEFGVDFGTQKSELDKYITDIYLEVTLKAKDIAASLAAKESAPLAHSPRNNLTQATPVPASTTNLTPPSTQTTHNAHSSQPLLGKANSSNSEPSKAKLEDINTEIVIKEEVIDKMISPVRESLKTNTKSKPSKKRVLSSELVHSDEDEMHWPAQETPKKKPRPSKKRVLSSEKVHSDVDDTPKKTPSKSGWTVSCSLSPELASIVGATELPRTQVVKKLWEYIKHHGLQNPNDKRYIIPDEKLFAVLKVKKVHYMTMNKYLSKHIKKIDTGVKKESPPKKRGGNRFRRVHKLSPTLSEVVGVDRLPRTQVVKKLWDYIKSHSLQDPSNAQIIRNDALMQSVFKTESMTMFEMNKV